MHYSVHTLISYPAGRYRAAWEKVLYNQFHDILPGSCVQDSREDAMARFRQVLTVANTEAAGAMRAISQRVDTAFVPYVEDEQSRAEGAGVGYNAKNYIIPAAERGSGETRLFHVFNPSAFERQAVAELTVWDWCFEPKQATACLPDGTPLPCQLLDVQEDTALYSNPLYSNRGRFWGHKMFTLLVQVTVPALGYATVIIKKAPEEKISPMYSLAPRTEAPPPCVMENEYLRVTFAPGTPQLVSIIDMAGGKELLGKAEDGGFRLIQEETSARLNAWTVGQYMSNVPAGSNHRIVNRHLEPNAVRQYIDAQASFGDSTLQYRITLEKDSPALHFSVYVDWQEKPVRGESIPQLAYRLPLAYGCGGYKYDVPFGVVLREGMHQDLPGLSFACGVPANPDEAALCLVSETKYGFRCVENSLALALLRSAYNPDPYPELGEHCFGFSIRLTQGTNNLALLKGAEESTRGFNSLSGPQRQLANRFKLCAGKRRHGHAKRREKR